MKRIGDIVIERHTENKKVWERPQSFYNNDSFSHLCNLGSKRHIYPKKSYEKIWPSFSVSFSNAVSSNVVQFWRGKGRGIPNLSQFGLDFFALPSVVGKDFLVSTKKIPWPKNIMDLFLLM